MAVRFYMPSILDLFNEDFHSTNNVPHMILSALGAWIHLPFLTAWGVRCYSSPFIRDEKTESEKLSKCLEAAEWQLQCGHPGYKARAPLTRPSLSCAARPKEVLSQDNSSSKSPHWRPNRPIHGTRTVTSSRTIWYWSYKDWSKLAWLYQRTDSHLRASYRRSYISSCG